MPRTEYPKKPAIRFCRACGYELALDNDGPCPMCPPLDQLRLNSVVPRPSELRARRARARNTQRSAAPAEWRPTVAEYRAMLAARRVAFTDESRGRVIRTPPAGEAAAARRVESRCRGGATRAWLVPVAFIVMSALIGLVVSILLSSF